MTPTRRKQKPLLERFLLKVDKTDTCWLWSAAVNPKGYGCLGLGTRGMGVVLAHRASWMLYKGAIPEGLSVLHSCDNPRCVNPDHLFLGTQQDNMKDRDAKGRQHNMLKTHCPKGHEYDAANTYTYDGTRRCCRACDSARTKARRVKNAG